MCLILETLWYSQYICHWLSMQMRWLLVVSYLLSCYCHPYKKNIIYDHSDGLINCGLLLLYGDKRFGSTLAQMIDWYLMVPSLYLHQYWLIIKGVIWHSSESNFIKVLMNLLCNRCAEIILLKSLSQCQGANELTHWGWATHICVSKLTIISSDNGLSPGQRQAIIWTNAGILLIGTLGTKFSEILSEIHTFSFKKIRLKTSSVKWLPFCFDLNELMEMRCKSDA